MEITPVGTPSDQSSRIKDQDPIEEYLGSGKPSEDEDQNKEDSTFDAILKKFERVKTISQGFQQQEESREVPPSPIPPTTQSHVPVPQSPTYSSSSGKVAQALKVPIPPTRGRAISTPTRVGTKPKPSNIIFEFPPHGVEGEERSNMRVEDPPEYNPMPPPFLPPRIRRPEMEPNLMPPPLLPTLVRRPEAKTSEPPPYIPPPLRASKVGGGGIKNTKVPEGVSVKKVKVPSVKRDHYHVFRDLCEEMKVYISRFNELIARHGADKPEEANYLREKCDSLVLRIWELFPDDYVPFKVNEILKQIEGAMEDVHRLYDSVMHIDRNNERDLVMQPRRELPESLKTRENAGNEIISRNNFPVKSGKGKKSAVSSSAPPPIATISSEAHATLTSCLNSWKMSPGAVQKIGSQLQAKSSYSQPQTAEPAYIRPPTVSQAVRLETRERGRGSGRDGSSNGGSQSPPRSPARGRVTERRGREDSSSDSQSPQRKTSKDPHPPVCTPVLPTSRSNERPRTPYSPSYYNAWTQAIMMQNRWMGFSPPPQLFPSPQFFPSPYGMIPPPFPAFPPLHHLYPSQSSSGGSQPQPPSRPPYYHQLMQHYPWHPPQESGVNRGELVNSKVVVDIGSHNESGSHTNTPVSIQDLHNNIPFQSYVDPSEVVEVVMGKGSEEKK